MLEAIVTTGQLGDAAAGRYVVATLLAHRDAVTPGYHLVKIRIRRADHTTPVLEIHYEGGAAPRIVGLVR